MASTDKPEDNRKFAKKNEASFPILSDPEKTISKAYGVLSGFGFAKRWTFYIDGEGVIRKIDKEVKPRTAGSDLVKNMENLKFPKVGG
jgi:peroxiredoxin Q/BCP